MNLSTSPLTAHIEQFTPDVEAWFASLQTWPGAILAFERGVLAWFKARAPQIVTYWRRYVPNQNDYLSESGGERWLAECGDVSMCDYVLGANEANGDSREHRKAVRAGRARPLTRAEMLTAMQGMNDHYVGLARAGAQRGVRIAGPNVSVGCPDDADVPIMAPCIDAILNGGGMVTYHGYGPRYLHTAEEWLLHRAAIRWPVFGAQAPYGRIAYTESGFEQLGTVNGVPSGPWRELRRNGLIDEAGVCQEYQILAASCRLRGVRHCALFTFGGTPEWRDYTHEVSPVILDWLAQHWAANVTPALPYVVLAPYVAH